MGGEKEEAEGGGAVPEDGGGGGELGSPCEAPVPRAEESGLRKWVAFGKRKCR